MRDDQVPQDNSKSYSGHKKLVYAVDGDGHYKKVQSSGWEVENFATQMAVEDINQQTEDAIQAVKNGELSVLSYHMFKHRMDVTTLSQISGFYQWQVRRHLKPHIFEGLSQRKIKIYCDVFNLTSTQLTSFNEFK